MIFRMQKTLSAVMALSVLAAGITPAALARDYNDWSLDNLIHQPIVKQAAIGAGVGAVGGALSDRTSVGRAAGTGAVVGVATGALSQSRYMEDKPLLRRTLQGAAVGTGVTYATRRNNVTGALVGAGAGAGYHYVRKYLDERY